MGTQTLGMEDHRVPMSPKSQGDTEKWAYCQYLGTIQTEFKQKNSVSKGGK
jgi:hypothetical protein